MVNSVPCREDSCISQRVCCEYKAGKLTAFAALSSIIHFWYIAVVPMRLLRRGVYKRSPLCGCASCVRICLRVFFLQTPQEVYTVIMPPPKSHVFVALNVRARCLCAASVGGGCAYSAQNKGAYIDMIKASASINRGREILRGPPFNVQSYIVSS